MRSWLRGPAAGDPERISIQCPFASTRRRARSRCNDSNGDRRPVSNVYANYDACIYDECLSMKSCGNSKVDDMIGHDDVTGLYSVYDIYDEDSPRTACNDATICCMGGEDGVTEYLYDAPHMMNYFSACDDQRHDYALFNPMDGSYWR